MYKVFLHVPHHKDRYGFTLVEVVIVIGLVTILLAIATPNFLAWLPDMKLKAASREIYSVIQRAKIGAIKDGEDWAIEFDVNGNILNLFSDYDGANESPIATVDLSSYQHGVQFGNGSATVAATQSGTIPSDFVSYANDTLVFSSRGVGNGGYVYLENELATTAYAVGTLTSGAVKLLKWNGTAWQ